MKTIFYGLCAACLLFAIPSFAQAPRAVDRRLGPEEENLNVLVRWIKWNNPGSALMNHLIAEANTLYDARNAEIAKLKTRAEWETRQALVRAKLMEIVGPFPEKTPLKAVITGKIKKKGYTLEKVVYQAMPGFHVTGSLFIPDGLKGKAPAVLNVIGHEQESYKAELDQVIILNLVSKGIIVFTIDPLGQGEHVQYFDPKIKFSRIGYSVVEHCYFGNQCFLSGSSGARYFTWDAIRAIDYLVSRREVDADRIGATGFSGGGTVTAYVAAFDDRVKVSVPCSWSIAARRLLEMKGPQDAEATMTHSLKKGITFEDLIEVRAPKPTLMTFTSRDEYLNLEAALEAHREAQLAYAAFGQKENLQFAEDDSKHWLTPRIRLAIFSFFMKHFNLPGDPTEKDVELLTEQELTVTPTGQISTSFGGDMVFDVNARETAMLAERLETSRKNIAQHTDEVRQKARAISGYVSPGTQAGHAFLNGRYIRDGYSVSKYALRGEGDYPIPFLLFAPTGNGRRLPAIVYLHSKGKVTDALPGGEVEKLVKQGYIVAAADLLGTGEMKNTAGRGHTDGYAAVLIGRSVVGIQAGDIGRLVNYLKSRDDVDGDRVAAVAFGELCLPLIHAAAFEPSLKTVALLGSPISYRSIAMNRIYQIGLTVNEGGGTHHPYEADFSWGIAGVLTAYDLPDLIASMAPRRVALVDLRDHLFEPASPDLIELEMKFPGSAYGSNRVSQNLKVMPKEESLSSVMKWAFEQ